jgi:hypothetical protein
MLEMLQAHGLDAGPTQRPLLAGAIAGLLADLPALALLAAFGTFDQLVDAAGGSWPSVIALHAAAMALGGIGYGLLFRRAANDPGGGWLFGMSYGFLLWLVLAVPLLQWLPPEPLMVGTAALGLYLGQVLWGMALGLAFRLVHRPLQGGVDARAPSLVEKAGSR